MTPLTCFKAYDIRGRVGIDLDEGIARRIARAFAEVLGARRVVLGRDCRASSESLASAVADGLASAGVEVLDLGLCGTEEVYCATGLLDADGGIEVTASHNPIDYNGMKLVGRGAAQLDPDGPLAAIRALAETGAFAPDQAGGSVRSVPGQRDAYVGRVLSFVDVAAMTPLKIVVDAGNGAAGPTFDAIAAELERRRAPLRFVRMHHDPDATFPNGIPNPLLPENQPRTSAAVAEHAADFAVAWDGDFDRCFFFDGKGRFIDGEYIVGLLAAAFLEKHPGATIIHDPRILLNTRDIVAASGGRAIAAPTGHAFLKRAMRDADAVYGGEMSAHHYFRDFFFCDSGMIPWLLVAELLGRRNTSLAALIDDRRTLFPSSGEINFRLPDPDAAIARVLAAYPDGVHDHLDGLSVSYPGWRFNLRRSNTEPVVRLNVESSADAMRVISAVDRISALLTG